MKKLILLLTAILFIALNVISYRNSQAKKTEQKKEQAIIGYQTVDLVSSIGEMTFINLPSSIEKTTYFVKVGNTISKLEDKDGYIIAAKRLGMETIQIIPDGKVYRTVSLDLKKDNEALKEAIEVNLNEIIISN